MSSPSKDALVKAEVSLPAVAPAEASAEAPTSTAPTDVPVPEGFRWIDGRVVNAVYMLPNNGIERDRLNGQHFQFRFILQG